jgi:8-oxo-dGTP diphosphatase
VLRGLELPLVHGVSAAGFLGVDAFLRRLGDALERGLRLVQLREPDLSTGDLDRLFGEVRAMTRSAGALLLVNSRHPRTLWESADGVHLTSHALATIGERPAHPWVGASVHDEKELARAGELGLDFAVLGPVQVTASHPGRSPLGWTEFERIAVGTSLPVYAIGGLDSEALPAAMARGAHGVALLSAAWRADQCFDRAASFGGVSSDSSAAPPGTT